MAQDNAAQAIKDLQKNLEEADLRVKALANDIPAYFQKLTSVFSEAAKSSQVSIDQIFDYIAKKNKSVSAAEKIKLQLDTAGAKRQIEDAMAKIKQALANGAKSVVIGGETISGKGAMESRLKVLEEELQGSKKSAAQLYDELMKIINASAETKKTNVGTRLGQEQARQMEAVRKTMQDINGLIEERNKREANLSKQGKTDKYYELQRKKIQQINEEIEKYKRTLDSLGGRGRQALASISGDGSASALKQQEANFRRLNRLLNERRKLEAQIQSQGGKATEVQARYQTTLAEAIQKTVQSMRELGRQYQGITKQAAQNTMVERAQRTKKTIDSINKSLGKNLLPTLQRLASAFGIAFSVRGLVQFGKKLIETRGEFEMQQVALRQIIQNKQLADEIWDKTMQAALQSPFTAMQLTKYTKQLAAYRIETDKLFDTTKRLADVSAGLGVDMQRLILAYGQVKAANYLRASEIRQFTEAGVNILGELSQYFTDTREGMYSTAQVMEMVTKRLVKFEDVEAIFKRMTDQGGIFYDMQKVQSQTVKGQIAKLHDAYDQMLNSIGKANEGVLKDFVSALNNIVKNWRTWASVLKSIGWGAAIGFISKFVFKLTGLQKASIATLRSIVKLKQGFQSLGTAFLANWPMIAVAAIAALISSFVSLDKKMRQVNHDIDEQNLRLYETRQNFQDMKSKIEANNAVLKNHESNTEDLNKAQKENESIMQKLRNEYPQLAEKMAIATNGIIEMNGALDVNIRKLNEQMTLLNAMKQDNWFSDSDIKNLSDWEGALSTMKVTLNSAQASARMLIMNMELAGEKSGKEYEILKKVSELDLDGNILDAVEAFKELNNLYSGGGLPLITPYSNTAAKQTTLYDVLGIKPYKLSADWSYNRVSDVLDKLQATLQMDYESGIRDNAEFMEIINEQYGGDINKFIVENADKINQATLDGLNEANSILINTLKPQTEEMRVFLNKELNKRFGTEGIDYFSTSIGDKKTNKELQDWQKRVNEAIDKASSDLEQQRSKLSEEAQKNLPLIELYKIVDPEKSLEEAQKDILDRLSKVRAKISSYELKGQVAINNTDYQALKQEEGELDFIRILLGAIVKTPSGGGNKVDAAWKRRISLLEEMKKRYDELSKSAYGYAKSESEVRRAFDDSFAEIFGGTGISMGMVDFTSMKGMYNSMKLLLQQASGISDAVRDELMKKIDSFEAQITIDAQVKLREDFGKQMEEMFNNYELTLDLEKFSLPADELAGIFDFDLTTVEALRDAVEKFYYEQKSLGADSEDLVKQVEGFNKKIDEMERKELMNRLKKYTEYLTKGRDEAVQIHLDELKAMAEIDELYAKGYYTETQYKDITKGVRKEADEKLAKQTWKDFKESDYYVTMFEDIDHVATSSIDLMISRLKGLQKSMNNLDPTQVKEIVQAIEKLEKQKRERSPLKSFFEDIKTWRNWSKKSGDNEKWLGFLSTSEDYWSKEKASKVKEVAQLEQEYNQLALDGETENAAAAKNRWEFAKEELDDINERLEKYRKKIADINKENNEGFAAMQRVLQGVAQGAQYFSDMASAAGTIATEMMDMFDNVDDASKKLAKDVVDIATNTALLAADIAKAIASEGTDVGSMIDGLVRTWNIIKSSLSASEVKINRIIEKQTDLLEDLEFQLDRLQRARDRAWETYEFVRNEREIEYSIQRQIRAYDELISAEEDRKTKDKDLIKQWKQEREELFENLQDEKEEFTKAWGGIGEGEYRDAAQGFVDAWKQAFLDTGDGLQGLEDHFDEFLNEWFVKQATLRVSGRMLEPLFQDIDDAVDKYGVGGSRVLSSELERIKEKFGIIAPSLSDSLEQLYGMFGLGGEGSLSGLAAGIQGMTEEQAEILEAYWNSVRGYTANIDMNVSRIAQILGAGGDNTNPMLQQMVLVAQNTNNINTLLKSVVKSGHPMGESGIKVFVN